MLWRRVIFSNVTTFSFLNTIDLYLFMVVLFLGFNPKHTYVTTCVLICTHFLKNVCEFMVHPTSKTGSKEKGNQNLGATETLTWFIGQIIFSNREKKKQVER